MIVWIRGGSLILTASTSWRSNCFRAPQEYFEGGPLLRLPSQSSCPLRPAADHCCCCCWCSPSTGWARTSAQTWSGMQRRTSVADQTMASLLRILTRISGEFIHARCFFAYFTGWQFLSFFCKSFEISLHSMLNTACELFAAWGHFMGSPIKA